MIWRLMASILTLSEPGGTTVTANSTDWPSQQQCQQILQDFFTPPPPQTLNGRRITIKISATCVPLDGDGLPPPVAEMPPPVAALPPRAYVEQWNGPYYGPPTPPAYDERRLYRRGDLPPSQRLLPF